MEINKTISSRQNISTNKKHKYKYDTIFISISLIIIILISIITLFTNKSESLEAEIWYKDTIIDVIDLSKVDNDEENIKEYKLDNNIVKVKYKKNAIRVIESTCPNHICEYSGYSTMPNKPIICMEIGFRILIIGKNSYDVVVG